MKRGEIWRVVLPHTRSHVQQGTRPAVSIQDDAAIANLPTVFIVPFTSNTAAARYPGTVVVQPDGKNGLTFASVGMTFQTNVADKRDCTLQLGEIDARTLELIFEALDRVTGR
jgi:mRNA interferase MazF